MAIDDNAPGSAGVTSNNSRPRRLSPVQVLQILIALALCLVLFTLASQDEVSRTDQMLIDAVETGDLQAARSAVAQGASVNHRDWIGSTPLHTAAWRGDLAMARLLIEAGAHVDVTDSQSGETPLHSAARGAEPAMLTFLLEAGADPQARTLNDSEQCNGTIFPAGLTALDIARINGLTQMEQILADEPPLVQ